MQCAKQAPGTLTCGFFACEQLSKAYKYSSSWNQLKSAEEYQQPSRTIENPKFKEIVNDICKCIMDDVVDIEGQWFDHTSALAGNEKYTALCTWRDSLDMTDYSLPDFV